MFTIGDFARQGGVSVRTLRYYEEEGLLSPASVDPTTGYRRYSAHQLPRLHRIVALKDLGLSLRQLAPLLDELSAEQLRGMLRLKRAELLDQLSHDKVRLNRVESRLRQIEGEDHVPADIVVKELPEFRAAAIRCAEAGLNFNNAPQAIEPALGELASRLQMAGVRPAGPFFIFYEPGASENDLIPNVAVAVGDQLVPVDDLVMEVTVPAVRAATTIYHGRGEHDEIGPLYGQLARWAEDQGYQLPGSGRDVIVDVGEGRGSEHVIELQLPIELGRADG
jgi:DNA-binding transcriptional MerR regulator